MGPHTLVIKRGEYGAILFRADSYFIAPGYLLETVFDPTGAGDCFAGGFIGYLAQQGIDLEKDHISRGELRRAVIYGSVMGSFCCEQFGVERFRTLTAGGDRCAVRRIPQLHVVLALLGRRLAGGDRHRRRVVVLRARVSALLRRCRSAPQHRPPDCGFPHARARSDRHRLAPAAAFSVDSVRDARPCGTAGWRALFLASRVS